MASNSSGRTNDGLSSTLEHTMTSAIGASSNNNSNGASDGNIPSNIGNLMYNQMLSNCNGMPLNLAELYRQQNYFPPSSLNQMGQLPPTIQGVPSIPGVPPFVLAPPTDQLAFALHSKIIGYNVKEKKNGLRKGKWTLEEENYTNKIIEMFNNSLLQLPSESNGITLRTYLAEKLNCDPMRITKKYAGASCLGKRVYHATLNSRVNPDVLAQAQNELAELEIKFKEKVEYSGEKDHGTDSNVAGKSRPTNPMLPWPLGYPMQVPPGMASDSQVAPGLLLNNYAPGGSKVSIPMPMFPGVGMIPPLAGEIETSQQYNYLNPYFQSLYQAQSASQHLNNNDNTNGNSTSGDSRNSDSRSDSSSNSNEKTKKNTKETKIASARMSTTSSSSAATTKSSSNRGYTQNGKKESNSGNSDSGSGRGSGSRGSGSGSDGDRGSGSGNCSDEGSRSGSGSDENGNRSHQPLSNQSLIQHNQINEHKNYSHNKGGGTSSDKSSSEKSSGDEDNFAASNLLVGFINHVHSVSQNALNDPNLVNETNRRNAVLAAAAAAGNSSSYSGSEDESESPDQARKKRKTPKLSPEVIAVLNINPVNPS